jgi:hypothetical protein
MPAATVPDHRAIFQRGNLSGPLPPSLAAFRRRFFEELSSVVMGSRIDVLDQLRPILEKFRDSNDQVEVSETLREANVVFEKGLFNCLDSMGSLVREWFSKLVKLAEHHPEWTIDDSARWVRCRMQELLDMHLSEQQDSKRPWAHVADRWLRYVCRYLYDSETDLPESWCAPIWFEDVHGSLWIRKGCLYHLTAKQTQHVVERWRVMFDGRLKNELDRAEDYARIDLEASPATKQAPAATTLTERPADGVHVTRAILVEKIRREIVNISQRIELLEDYDTSVRGASAFAGYITVDVCNRHSDLCDKLCVIKTTKKPNIIMLACQIASAHACADNSKPLLPQTFRDAHKRYGSEARTRLNQRQ